MSETDEEFLNWLRPRVGATSPQNLDRLFALARRGADAADEIERLRAALRLWGLIDWDNMAEHDQALLDEAINGTRTALKEDGE